MADERLRPGRARVRERVGRRWRLVSPSGARVVSTRLLDARTRARVLLPSLFTLGNMLAGFSSVLFSFQQEFTTAAALVAVSVVLDMCDGAVARAIGATTPFGVQFDSLADLISFGVAPAVLVHTWAFSDQPVWAWLGAMLWLACAAFRLARFNVTVEHVSDKRYFMGLPSPAAAAVVIATVYAMAGPLQLESAVLPVGASIVPALLMVTTVRFRSFRALLTPNPDKAWLTVALAAAAALGLIIAPALTLVVIAYGYLFTAPLGWLTRPVRRAWLGEASVAPPRQKLPSVFLTIEPGEGEIDDEDSDVDDPDIEDCTSQTSASPAADA
ncbi:MULTISPECIES: CDP-diacylglycerol--serine O-phosphatidyltransferase [unclassified Janibacter]|uniref:CDP-diacylglycerol--serine O-phosphatidyltransferase n=1 Tax=unclassified Janibacter TaxID=2649294 RepID=UPI003CFE0B53